MNVFLKRASLYSIRQYSTESNLKDTPKVFERWPFNYKRPLSYFCEKIVPSYKRTKKVSLILTKVMNPIAYNSFRAAAFETCKAFQSYDIPTLKYTMESSFFNHINPLLEYLKENKEKYSIKFNNPENPYIDIPYLMKYEVDMGLFMDRSQNDIEKNYLRINGISAGNYRRYVYIKKKGLSFALIRVVRVDVVLKTSFSLSLAESEKKQDLNRSIWTFETNNEYKECPFLFPKDFKFDENLLKSANFVGPVSEIIKLRETDKEFYAPKSDRGSPNIPLKKIYIDEKDKWESMRPELSTKGWKLADIDYAMNGNPLFKNSK